MEGNNIHVLLKNFRDLLDQPSDTNKTSTNELFNIVRTVKNQKLNDEFLLKDLSVEELSIYNQLLIFANL